MAHAGEAVTAASVTVREAPEDTTWGCAYGLCGDQARFIVTVGDDEIGACDKHLATVCRGTTVVPNG